MRVSTEDTRICFMMGIACRTVYLMTGFRASAQAV